MSTADARHACPCCGHRTLDREPPGTFLVCPVCYWQDATPGQPSHNPAPLWRAQRMFDEYLVSDEAWYPHTREPSPDELAPSGGRTPLDPTPWMLAERDEVIGQIAAAFDGVAREDGVTLRQADVIDAYGSPAEETAARLLDTDTRWQDVPDDDLARYHSCVMSYFDAKGFRYYLPAFMTWQLREFEAPGTWIDVFLLFHLERARYRPERLDLLTDAQSRVVYRFLKFVADYSDEFTADDAHRCLRSAYWSRFGGATLTSASTPQDRR